MSVYYNEIDPIAAATIREAIARNLVAPGLVDERDIRDIAPNELAGFTQVHLFAGGGIWSYAARRAGWPDWLPFWTCSCPCQPFSQAGKGAGFDDERHLWPAAQWLIEQCNPVVVVGEQVADKGADPWIDLVQADLEAMDYAFGCVPLASAGFGAPNPRHRTFWMAHALGCGCEGQCRCGEDGASEYRDADRLGDAVCYGAGSVCGDSDSGQGKTDGNDRHISRAGIAVGHAGAFGGLANPNGSRCEPGWDGPETAGYGDTAHTDGGPCRVADPASIGHEWTGPARRRGNGPSNYSSIIRVADALRARLAKRPGPADRCGALWIEGEAVAESGIRSGLAERQAGDSVRDQGPTNGFWSDADWLYCRDPRGARWRPVDAGTFPLAPGHPSRVGGLRISGNAINAEVATGFIEAVIDHLTSEIAA